MRAFVTIGDIKELNTERYKRTKEYTGFKQALYLLAHERKKYFDKPLLKPSHIQSFHKDDKFIELLYSLPVDITPILNSKDEELGKPPAHLHIKEENIIPPKHDLFAFIHIPYVNDGIHTHDHFEINYVYRGCCNQIFKNETRVLLQGDLCIIAPNSPHNVRVKNEDITISILIRKSTFDNIFWRVLSTNDLLSTFFRNTLYGDTSPNYLCINTNGGDAIRYYMQQIVLESNYADEYSNNVLQSYIILLFTSIIRYDKQNFYWYNPNSSKDAYLEFSAVLHYIQQNYQTVTLKHIADQFHYTEATLSKYISKNFGRSFSKIIQQIKMQRAKELIQHTKLPVHKIADIVGYQSVDHFSRTYKKVYGISPSEDPIKIPPYS